MGHFARQFRIRNFVSIGEVSNWNEIKKKKLEGVRGRMVVFVLHVIMSIRAVEQQYYTNNDW